ncbi:MAG: DUF1684 domain-containing protein [Chloroflexi bacterium]|nr:DUF1684 domain-containing protein [Chloroflexota bacterium]
MSEIGDFRKGKDQHFGSGKESPLTPGQRKRLRGLQYFPENPKLQFVLPVDEFSEDEREVIEMATSTGQTQAYLRWGRLRFEVDGTPVVLTVYRDVDGDEVFMPFMDSTNGEDSYSNGRYLDLVDNGDGRLSVDFNYAYNPYCAYNPNWSCPIPLAENRLSVAIKAGEKIFTDAEAG